MDSDRTDTYDSWVAWNERLYVMQFELTLEDFTIIQNALHYYKHVEKRGNFQRFDVKRCEELRDKLAKQMSPDPFLWNIFSCATLWTGTMRGL